MSDVFDPYCRWLGLPDDRRPANHYELLGIDLYESDPGVIARAADALTARVRSIRPGQHVVQWRQLLDDLAEAKRCLLDPSAKADYDAALRGGTGPKEPAPGAQAAPWDPSAPLPAAAQTPAQPVPIWAAPMSAPGPSDAADGPAPAEAGPWSPADGAANGSTSPRANARPRSSATWAAAQLGFGILVGVLVMGAAMLAYRLFHRQEGPSAGERSVWQADSKAPSATGDSTGSSTRKTTSAPDGGPRSAKEPRQSPGRDAAPKHAPVAQAAFKGPPQPHQEAKPQAVPGPEPPPETEPQPGPLPKGPSSQGPESASPADGARQQALGQAILEVRRSMAAHDLDGARRHLSAAVQSAKTPEEQATVGRLNTLLGHLEAFWSRMGRVLAGLGAAETLPIGETFVAVVESSPEEVTVKAAGQMRTYRLRQMPPKLTRALIDTKFPHDAAAKMLIGAYLAVDPDGDPGRARQLWQEAAQQGADLEDLMPELEHWAGRSDLGPEAHDRTPPPSDPSQLQQAEQALKARFKAEYDGAAGIPGRSRLASLLLKGAGAEDDDPVTRFVMLREARDLAAQAGDSELACQAVDQIARFYEVDLLGMKTAALAEAAKSARGLDGRRALVQSSLRLIEQAAQAGRLEEAKQLAEVALLAARESRSKTLIQQALAAGRHVEALEKPAEP